MYNVAFPNLNLYFNINKIAFSFFGKEIYWYGIIIVSAVLIGLFLRKRDKTVYNISYENTENFILWALPISIIGARIYYVIFSWGRYKENLIDIFKIWNGGLAIYGGIICAIITGIVFCKVKKLNVLDLFDSCIPYLALGQAIGRWGNFANREAYGALTDSFLRMEILENGKYISVHPTFLYESFGLVIIFVLLKLNKRKFSGQQTAIYFLFYGLVRFFIEYLRTDSLMLGNIKVSMLVSALITVIGFVTLIKERNKV